MWPRPTTSRSVSLLVALIGWGAPSVARAQACCAGGSAVAPARLELHEDALVGVQMRAAGVFGSYGIDGTYVGAPPSTSEFDYEQDLFGALRVTKHSQLALLAPLLETERSTLPDGSHVGGGIGDVNVSARYDFVMAGESRYAPGVALLAGLTLPTGKPAESASLPLAVDTTGIGAFQANVAVALEQTFGPWLINATGILAARTSRFGETLGPQTTLLGAGAYTFPNDAAVALALSYAFVPDAKDSGGATIPFTSTRLTTVTATVLYPLGDTWRIVGGAFLNPPVGVLGSSQTATSGLTLAVIRSWS